MYSLAELHTALADTWFANHLHFFPSIHSTNTHAMAEARNGAPHGSVYFADEQTAGRGRGDHNWHSQSGLGLYVSVLVRPQIPAAHLTWLPLLTGLAVHTAIAETTGLTADIRWPNDILIGPRKTCGILVESGTDASQGIYAILGIGINTHQTVFPPEVAETATSLDLETGRVVSRQQLLIALLQSLQRELTQLNDATSLARIPDRIAAASTWICGKHVAVHGPQAMTGTTAGLDDRGFLRIENAGNITTIITGGIRAL